MKVRIWLLISLFTLMGVCIYRAIAESSKLFIVVACVMFICILAQLEGRSWRR